MLKWFFKTKRHFYGYIEYLMILQSSVAAGSTLMNQQIRKKKLREKISNSHINERVFQEFVSLYLQHFDSKIVGFSNCFAIDKR